MSIEIGKIKIIEEINDLELFRFKQNHVEYYAVRLSIMGDNEGHLVFNLDKKIDKLFRENEYSEVVMVELFKSKVNKLYFLSFADEDPHSEIVEFVGELDKDYAVELYTKKGQ